MSNSKDSFLASRAASRSDGRKDKRAGDDLSYSTASSTSQLVQIASYGVDGPVLRLFSDSSDAADTGHTQDTVDGSRMSRRVAVTVYDGSESESSGSGSSGSGTSESATRSSTTSIASEIAQVGSRSIITPPCQRRSPKRAEFQLQRQVPPETLQRQVSPETSFFGSMFSCFHPDTRNEIAFEPGTPLKPLPGDALDNVFGAVEGLVCHETSSIDPKNRALLAREFDNNHDKDILDNVFEGLERGICANEMTEEDTEKKLSRLKSERRMRNMANSKARELAKYERDMLDNIFDGVEKVACSDHGKHGKCDKESPAKKDMLDRMFEGIEGVACRDDHESIDERCRKMQNLRGMDPPGYCRQKKRMVKRVQQEDALDYVCGNFERAVGLDGVVTRDVQGPDILDNVCEAVQFTVCRDSSRTGGSESPIDLTTLSGFSLEKQNSIIDPIRDYEEIERRQALQKIRERGRPKPNDRVIASRVFKDSESKMHPHHRSALRLNGTHDTKAANHQHVRRDNPRNYRKIYYVKAGE